METKSSVLRPFRDRVPTLGARADVDPAASVIGDVVLGDDVSVWPFTVVRGDVNFIRVGDRTNLQDGSVIHVKRPSDDKLHCALHGMTRALLHNMVVGVSEGFKKELEINGVGYRAAKEGKNLVMNLGYSHQVIVPEIDGITIDVPSANKVVISGPDKQKVGQFAAEVREKRPPEPYKGKGIKYVDETIRRKVGKTGAKK